MNFGVGLPMRAPLPFAAAILLLSSISGAEAAEPTLLAETGAFLLGNAYRCGVSTERVTRAGKVIRGMIASLSKDAGEKEVAGARFSEMFRLTADRDVLIPPCSVVVTQFERLERHHREAGYTE
jgi:hypothetical protein